MMVNKRGLLKNNNGFITMTEKGLKYYSEMLKRSEPLLIVTVKSVIDILNKDEKPYSLSELCEEITNNKSHKMINKSRFTIRKMIDSGQIIRHSKVNHSVYYVKKGSTLSKRPVIKVTEEDPIQIYLTLYKILPGTLTGCTNAYGFRQAMMMKVYGNAVPS
jgi:hypothetical protein